MNDDQNSRISGLQYQIFLLRLALIVLSGAVVASFYWQSRMASRDMDALNGQAKQVFAAYGQNKALIENFEKQLIAYGQTHPDFRPVLAKYGLIQMQGAGATSPANTPASSIPKK